MKRESRRQALIEAIQEAGFVCLSQKAWSDITSDELAKTAKMTKRTMYAYFPSLNALYLQLVKVSFERLNAHIEPAIFASQSIAATLLAVGEAYFSFYRNHRVEGRLIVTFDSSAFEKSHADLVRDIARVANRYEPSRLLQASGCDPKTYPPSLGLFLWSSVQGLLSLLDSKASWLYDYYQMDYDAMVRAQIAWLKAVLPQETENKI